MNKGFNGGGLSLGWHIFFVRFHVLEEIKLLTQQHFRGTEFGRNAVHAEVFGK